MLSASILATGCQPQQPFYCNEDGDLSHYLDVATDIEYPDVDEPSLDEVNGTLAPLTLKNTDNYEMWDLSLEEAVRITLCNSQVMRQLGARVQSFAPETISRTLISPVAVTTTYDPALAESVTGLSVGSPFQGSGPEAALSEFDAQLDSSVFWEKNRRPQNRRLAFLRSAPISLLKNSATFTTGITKTTADGTTFGFRNNTIYEGNNIPFRGRLPSDWTTNFEATFSQPLLQGGGTQYNRIAGPFDFNQYAAGVGNPIDGVMIARIRTDQSLADFEGGVTGTDARRRRCLLGAVLHVSRPGSPQARPRQRVGDLEEDSRPVSQPAPRAAAPTARPRPVRSTSCSAARWNRRSPICTGGKPLAIHHGAVDVGRAADPAVGRADHGPRRLRLGGHPLRSDHAARGNPQGEMGNQAARAGIDRRSQPAAAAARRGRPLPLARLGR